MHVSTRGGALVATPGVAQRRIQRCTLALCDARSVMFAVICHSCAIVACWESVSREDVSRCLRHFQVEFVL